ncbi:hypothetical protein ACH41H_45825 [Streptomyces sp. NPDC020800]|uniref:hypothetical protein n=1 Tax=Streptomyces sp. NPDC020800 TaxID=3365092 RepID=UPI0037881720
MSVKSTREWLTVFLLPAYSPQLNPVEGAWAHIKCSLANLAVVAPDRLETLVRNRRKRLQYRLGVLDGFAAGTGPPLDTQHQPDEPRSVSDAVVFVTVLIGVPVSTTAPGRRARRGRYDSQLPEDQMARRNDALVFALGDSRLKLFKAVVGAP